MKAKRLPIALTILWICWSGSAVSQAGQGYALTLQRAEAMVNLAWPGSLEIAGQGTVFPEFTIERSSDLIHWQPIGGKLCAVSGRSGPWLSLTLDATASAGFYRVKADPSATALIELGDGGQEVFGYNARMAAALQQIGLLSAEAFANSAPVATYLPHLSWDPTAAQFWTNFHKAFPLNATELAVFLTNGFVVSERLGTYSFADAYYRIFTNDLPVFITTDSILQAWHRTYVNMLEELEELELATLLEQVLTNSAAQLPKAWQLYGRGPLSNSIVDADYYLTVARSLWTGAQAPSSLRLAAVTTNVASTLSAVSNLVLVDDFPIFGSTRSGVDFSQFKVRGHYTNSERLSRYFQAMMWCGQIDLRLATFAPNKEDDIRQLGNAIVLNHLLKQAGQYTNWAALDQITRVFVGITDSMTFAQLDQLLAAANIHSPADVPDLVTLTNLQTRLLTGELGVQGITGDKLYSPFSPEEVKLPRSFTVSGRKFILDSWAFQQIVFDKVHWPSTNTTADCGATNVFGKVIRRKPSGLDTAYAVLGNDQVVPNLVSRILTTNGVPFRDGLPYQHSLTAVRQVIDSQDPGVWTNNIYAAWLGALRALSSPTTNPQYPEAMRTRAWAMRTLNTQLASWTELRHDTLLYAKQSYTPPFLCSYPYGFVEPRLEFWQKMRALADVTAAAISALRLTGLISVPSRDTNYHFAVTYNLGWVRTNQAACLTNFAAKMVILQGIARKELAQQPLATNEADFLKSLVEQGGTCLAGARAFNGWYPRLFYRNVFSGAGFEEDAGSDKWDLEVADVHTDVPDPIVCDPGAVIHEAIGNVHFLLIAVDNGPDRMVYAGPVFSHYEFEVPGVSRLSDEDWKAMLQAGQKPPAPDWTRGYLVPSP